MKKSGRLLLTAILVIALTAGLGVPGLAVENDGKTVKNVIVMIADGGGFNQYLAADFYLYGAAGASIEDTFPVKLAMSTYSAGQSIGKEDDAEVVYDPGNWANPVKFQYGATDSAAAATAISTGVKTYDAAIGMDQNGSVLRHLIEDFEAHGKSTGVATSVPISHATPGGFVAHNSDRNNYHAIADEMIKNSATDVILGCGSPLYDDDGKPRSKPDYKFISEETWTALNSGQLTYNDANGDGIKDPWTFIQTKAEFEALTTGHTPGRVLGIVQCYQTLQEIRTSAVGDWTTEAPGTTPPNSNVPSLETMTKGALNVLDNDKDGFFLMIEGGAVDWAGHFGQPGRCIEEMEDFIKSIEAVCHWVDTYSSWDETLLIVTADHETGYLSGTETGLTDVVNNGKGVMPTMFYQLNTLDKKYSGMFWHSNQLVPFFAKGAGAELYNEVADQSDPVRGKYLDNTEISIVIRALLGGAPSKWAAGDVEAAANKGLVPADLKTDYLRSITREEFCRLAFGLLEKSGVTLMRPGAGDPMPFEDTDSDVIFTLYKLGIVNGVGGGQFAPEKTLKREEAAKILYNIAAYLKLPMQTTSFKYADDAAFSAWAADPIYKLYALGIMKGDDAGRFSPAGSYTVEQSIVTVLRLYTAQFG